MRRRRRRIHLQHRSWHDDSIVVMRRVKKCPAIIDVILRTAIPIYRGVS